MKNYMIKTCFASPTGTNAKANKTCINIVIFIVLFVDFLSWLSTGSYPADINRFRSQSGKLILLI